MADTGAERSHPASVAQAAFYTIGTYGQMRDACEWLGELAARHVLNGPDPDALPERDFTANTWQCRSCAFLDICLPGMADMSEEPETKGEEVTDPDARDAVTAYAKAQESIKEPEKAKRAALDTLMAWMRRKGDAKATVNGRTVSLVRTTRYSTNYRRLNELLAPEVRAEVVAESESEYVRVSYRYVDDQDRPAARFRRLVRPRVYETGGVWLREGLVPPADAVGGGGPRLAPPLPRPAQPPAPASLLGQLALGAGHRRGGDTPPSVGRRLRLQVLPQGRQAPRGPVGRRCVEKADAAQRHRSAAP